MSWRALLCSLHRFTVARRSLARSTRRTSRRSVSSGYVGRCRSGPLPSLPASHCRRRRWDRSLRRRRIMQRECAMIKDQPSSTADTIHPTRSSAGECVQPHYYREPIRKRRRWRRTSVGLGSTCGGPDSRGDGQMAGIHRCGVSQNSGSDWHLDDLLRFSTPSPPTVSQPLPQNPRAVTNELELKAWKPRDGHMLGPAPASPPARPRLWPRADAFTRYCRDSRGAVSLPPG